nr:hypothetical protein [Tanacetum cinerariifolium]
PAPGRRVSRDTGAHAVDGRPAPQHRAGFRGRCPRLHPQKCRQRRNRGSHSDRDGGQALFVL